MKNNKKKIIFFFTLLLIIYLEPQLFKEDSIKYVGLIDNIYKVLKLFASFCLLIYYIFYYRKISKLFVFTSLLQIIMFISTVINGGDIVRFAGPAITTVTMVSAAEVLIDKKYIIEVLKYVNIYLRICFILNIISLVLIDGFSINFSNSVYFLGIDNRFVFTLIPWIVFEGIVSVYENGKLDKKWLLITIMSEIVLLLKFSVAAMLVVFLFIIIYFIPKVRYKSKYYGVLICYILSNILLIFLKIQNVFKPMLSILNKDVTLSGRTFLWDAIINLMKTNPLFGIGMQSTLFDKTFFYESTKPLYLEFCKVTHAHNSIMTYLYRGGIISVIVFIIILVYITKKLRDNSNSKYNKILFTFLIVVLILSLFDTIDFACLFFIFSIICNLNKIYIKQKERKNKIKILYTVYTIQNGGIEQFIYNYCERLDKNKFDIHILTQYPEHLEAEKKFKNLRIKIHKVVPKNNNIIKWFYTICNLLKKEKFDIIHSNMNITNFYILSLAKLFGVKVRISHYHTAQRTNSLKFKIFKKLNMIYATDLIACGELANEIAYDGKGIILYNSIDVDKFKFSEKNRDNIRKKLNVEKNQVLIGHFGRFSEEKNHKFIIDLMNKIIEKNSDYKLLLVGDGPLKEEIVADIKKRSISKSIIILKSQADIYKYYSALDCFILPSLYEGFPVVSIEAQSNGLICLFSNNISKEVLINKNSKLLDLKSSIWSKEILKVNNNYNRNTYYRTIKNSKYDINFSYTILEKLYVESVNKENNL